ncbi:MAG: putative branched-chain-amino-acid aminotransferase [Planctomycetota bacterium]|jgi:para-aminobenzoate synthetase/4-amino-4-deoxychorismate lyase
MGAVQARLPLWERHLGRLVGTAARLGLPFDPTPELLGAAVDLLLRNGHGDDVLRLALVPAAERVHVVLESRARGPAGAVLLVPTVVVRRPDDPPGDCKAAPRRFYDLVRQQAQDAQADDGIVVGLDGAVLETSVANLWLRIDGEWVTPPLDGRVLPGIARAVLLERAHAVGLRVAERACHLGDLHRADALAVSNAVHGPRPAHLCGSEPTGAPAVAAELVPLWRAALAGA